MTNLESPRNVVVVLADDLGYWALGCYGNHEARTPHLDALAADGVLFTDFYCTSPVCSPARASLITGKMPSSHGVLDWVRAGNGGSEPPIEYLSGQRTYTQILAENGYTCGISGKWHLGDSSRAQQGHAHWFVHPSGGGHYNNVPMYRDGELVQTEGYLSEVITDDAIDFMRAQATAQQPFHLSVNYTAPHGPWVDEHPAELVALFDDCEFETCPQEARHPWIKNHPIELHYSEQHAERSTIRVRDHLQGYFAAVTALDACVGRLREEIARLDLEEDTMVIFTSDNGYNCGHHGIWGKGSATFPQNMYDSSVKVPTIVALPGRFRPHVADAMLSGYDVLPTVLDFLGLAEETPEGLPGQSFLPLLDGDDSEDDRPVVIYDEYGPTRMIRDREWKYVHRYPYGPHELYNLQCDPDERINLLADSRVWELDEVDRVTVANALRRKLEVWFERYTDMRRDGRVQPVTGRGQQGLVDGADSQIFHPIETAHAPI